MDPLVIVVAIFLVPFLFFAVHVFRDIRGKNRNKHGLCYACGKAVFPEVPITHHRGGVFFYCSRCAKQQGLFKGFLVSIAVLAITATLAIQSLVKFESKPTESILFLVGAVSIVVMLIVVVVAYVRRQYKQSSLSKTASSPCGHGSSQSIMSSDTGESFAEARSEMEAVFLEGMRLESQGKLDAIAKARIEAKLQDISTKIDKNLAGSGQTGGGRFAAGESGRG